MVRGHSVGRDGFQVLHGVIMCLQVDETDLTFCRLQLLYGLVTRTWTRRCLPTSASRSRHGTCLFVTTHMHPCAVFRHHQKSLCTTLLCGIIACCCRLGYCAHSKVPKHTFGDPVPCVLRFLAFTFTTWNHSAIPIIYHPHLLRTVSFSTVLQTSLLWIHLSFVDNFAHRNDSKL
jgi:hypothetical protein